MTGSIFNTLNDKLSGNRTASDLHNFVESTGVKILSFPSALGDQATADGIPYVLFMPYHTGMGAGQLNSVDPTRVLDNLPPPKFAIALPLPPSALSTEYGVDYGEVELNGWGSIASGISSVFKDAMTPAESDNALKEMGGKFADQAGNVLGAVAHAGYSVLEGFAGAAGAEGLMKMLGVTQNPFTETIFKNVKFRSHTFSYKFTPKNEKEAKLIDDILQLFKFYMLPSNNPGSVIFGNTEGANFFSFPYEFQIIYSVSDTTFALLPSVLSSLSVTFSEGLPSPKFFISNATGKRYPVSTTVSMTFNEVMLLTRDKINITEPVVLWNDNPHPHASVKRYRF